MGALRFFSFALTLITLPYLTRALGVNNWGEIVFVQLIINYLLWITDWGFNYGASKRVAANRNNKYNLNILFSEVWCSQILLTIFVLGLLLLVVHVFSSLIHNPAYYIIYSGVILGNLLTPIWFLIGMEFIKEGAIIQLLAKVIALPLIFVFINSPEDVFKYLLIESLASIVVGFFSFLWIKKYFKLKIIFLGTRHLLKIIQDDFQLFINNTWATLNTSIVPLILGVVSGEVALALYNIADRAKSMALVILHPVSHSLFPRMCYLFSKEIEKAKKMLVYSGILLFFTSFAMSIALYMYSTEIISFLGGEGFINAENVLHVLAPLVLISTITSFIVNQLLIPTNQYKGFTISSLASLIISSLIIIPLVQKFNEIGASYTLLISEIFVLLILGFFVKKHKFF